MSFGQGGPDWGPGGSDSSQPQWGSTPDAPDWAALAEASEARARRRRLLLIGGSALATIAVGAAVAVAVVSAGGGDDTAGGPDGKLPATADIPPSESSGPGPSFEATTPPPPPDPKDFISSADKDKAPLSAATLFPGEEATVNGTSYKMGKTASTKKCASVTHGALGAVLTKNDCTRVIRATYRRDGVAVTVGVAVFDTEAQATKANKQVDKGNIVSLSGSGVPAFCNTAICRSTSNTYGRYAYFTVAGFTDGKDVTKKSTRAFAAGDDLAEFTFRQIIRRGEAQASAAANAPQQ